jgi:cytochrome c oxidase subunit 2
VFFEVGKFDIGDEGKKAIADAVAAAGKDGKVALTGFTDKTGDPAANEELAKNRAKAVKEALLAAGLADGGIEMRPPEFITGSADDRAARRVDIVKAN